MRSKSARILICLSGLSLLLAALVAIPAMRSAEAQTVSIQSKVTGNVFVEGDTPSFKLQADGDVNWAVRDYWGNRVARGSTSVDEQALLEVPGVDENGYYVLEVAVGEGEQLREEQAAFAMLPKPAAPANDGFTYGMQTHFSHGWNPDVAPLLRKIGVEAVRDQQSWEEIETKPGTYDFDVMNGRYQAYMDALKQNGINVMAQFGISNENYDNGATPYTDEGRKAYAQFVKAVLEHYGDQIKEISVYNEPNLPKFGDFGDGPADATPENYRKLLAEVYRVVKDYRPDVNVAGPEMAAAFSNDADWNPWLEDFIADGGLNYLDSLSIHPYRDRCCPPEGIGENLEAVRELMGENRAGSKPIWITEQGWTTDLLPDSKQARYLLRTYVLSMKEANRFNWYNFMDHRKSYGMLHSKGSALGRYTPKPSYVTYGVMTSQLAGLEFQAVDEQRPGGVRSLRFGGNGTTRVMWAPTDHKTVSLNTPGPVEVTDMMGESHTLEPVDGKVVLRLTGDPMYVSGEVQGIEEDNRFTLDGESSAVSDDIPAMLGLNNEDGSTSAATFAVDGSNYDLSAASGEVDQQRVDVASGGGSGRRVLQAEVHVDGKLNGLLSRDVSIRDDVKVRLIPRIPDTGDSTAGLNVEVTNNRRSADYQVSGVDWKVHKDNGSEQIDDITVGPMSTRLVPVTLPDKKHWKQFPSAATVHFEGKPSVNVTGEVGFNPAYKKDTTNTLDKDALETATEEASSKLDLAEDGVVQRTGAGIPYDGPKDLSGKMSFSVDESKLYVSAKVNDDEHFNDQTGRGIKTGDSVHIGLTRGMPGDTKEFYQYVTALTPDGPKARRQLAPPGEDTGPAENVEVSVERDDNGKTTTYEFAIPWDDLEQIDYEDSVFSLTTMVSDNDGDDAVDREGWIEWGSGIGAGKDPSLFRPIAIVGK